MLLQVRGRQALLQADDVLVLGFEIFEAQNLTGPGAEGRRSRGIWHDCQQDEGQLFQPGHLCCYLDAAVSICVATVGKTPERNARKKKYLLILQKPTLKLMAMLAECVKTPILCCRHSVVAGIYSTCLCNCLFAGLPFPLPRLKSRLCLHLRLDSSCHHPAAICSSPSQVSSTSSVSRRDPTNSR